MPYENFSKSAHCLDDKRLGKQRVECIQILDALLPNSPSKWRSHPAVLMWKGHENTLIVYGMCVCAEWITRKFEDNCLERITKYNTKFNSMFRPSWLGLEVFHAAHRSNLIRKKPEHYGKFGWTESPDLPYFWPTKNYALV